MKLKDKVFLQGSMECILCEDIDKVFDNETYEEFIDYINGQTCPVVDGECAYYWGDVERFLKGLPNID